MTKNKILISKFIAFSLLLTIALSLFSSCWTPSKDVYVAESKAEIEENIEAYESGQFKNRKYNYVSTYLRLFGLPIFDTNKVSTYEAYFITLYNYGDGLPDTLEHAVLTAGIFLEKYYDTVDHTNITAVTDAVLFSYTGALDDPYTVYRPPVEADSYTEDMSGKFGGIGVVIEYDDDDETIMISSINIGSPAEESGVRVGDYIHAIDGTLVSDIGYRNAVYHVRGEVGTNVTLTLKRGNEYIDVVICRAIVEDTNVAYSFDENSKLGYVQIAAFKGNTFEQFAKSIDALEKLGAKGIVFDLRNNPGGYLSSVVDVISYLVPNENTVVTYQYKGQLTTELQTETDVTSSGGKIDHKIDIPIVVLCNEYTASAGEIFTAAIRDYRKDGLVNAKIVGTNTYGKGVMQSTYQYKDASSITFTVAYYNPPSGKNYHGIGVAPDVTVELPMPEQDPQTGKYLPVEDTQLKEAFNQLKKLVAND